MSKIIEVPQPSLLDMVSAEELVDGLKNRCEILLVMYALPKDGEEEDRQYRLRDKGDSFTLLGVARHLEKKYENHLENCMEDG